MDKKVSDYQEILMEIKKYGDITEEYCIVMDFCSYFEECTDLNVLSSIEFLSNISLNKINKIFKNYHKKITQSQYNGLLELLKSFILKYLQISSNT